MISTYLSLTSKWKMSLKLVMVTAVMVLSGCSLFGVIPGSDLVLGEDGVFRDRQGDYLIAETLPRTQIPQGLDGYIIDDLLVIPELPASNQNTYLEVPRPVATVGRTERGVVIQRINDASWIIADVVPSQVWPRIRDYWSSNGIAMEVENPAEGVMETSWFVLKDNVLSQEKVKVTVTTGFQEDSSEISLLHITMPQASPVLGAANWSETSADAELEYDLLSRLSVYLADVADLYSASTVSFLAGTISSQGKASKVVTPEGLEIIKLDADYARSWAAVGVALERAGIEVLTSSRDDGMYEVDFIINKYEDDEGTGFFEKLVTINGLLGSFGEEEVIHSLRIKVLDTNNGVEVLIESSAPSSDQLESEEEAKASLLESILEHIA